jgi:hypothetical protein
LVAIILPLSANLYTMNNLPTSVVIASVLKPADDVRNFEKLAGTLTQSGHYQVTVAGREPRGSHPHNTINLHSWPHFKRLSIGRLFVPIRFYKLLRKTRPRVVIVTTFELLPMAVLYRWFHQTKLVYDVQEDYFRNLWFQHHYRPGFKQVLAIGIRKIELLCHPWISAYFLAEKCYLNDLKFTREKGVVLENKSLPIPAGERQPKAVFTGTITPYSKAAESIELFLKIKDHLGLESMTVIGHCPVKSYGQYLEETYGPNKFVRLELSVEPVPHQLICDEISTASLGIIGYQTDRVNRHKVPTKLFEYTSARLPFLVQAGSHWAAIGKELGGAIPVDFKSPEQAQLEGYFLHHDWSNTDYQWEEEVPHLIKKMNQILT